MLTEKQRLDYVMSKWSHCPKCGSEQIQGDSIEIDGNIAWQRVGCLDCDAEWIDTYTLSDVQTLNRKWDGGMEPEMASASELRRSLSCLLEVFDQLYAEGEDWEDDERVQQARRILAKGFSSETDDQITGTEEPKPGRPGGEWMEVFLGLLSIVEDEYELDPEPDDIQSWKDLIDRANRLLRFKPEQTEKGRDDGEAEQQRD